MLKIILARHGEERREKLNGLRIPAYDSPLTLRGVEQVKRLALKLKKFKITEIYSSDIKRTMQTAEIISKELNASIKIDKRLRERNAGDFEKYRDNWRIEFSKLKEKELSRRTPSREIRPPNGENLYDFKDRIKSLLIDLSKKNGNILLCFREEVPGNN